MCDPEKAWAYLLSAGRDESWYFDLRLWVVYSCSRCEVDQKEGGGGVESYLPDAGGDGSRRLGCQLKVQGLGDGEGRLRGGIDERHLHWLPTLTPNLEVQGPTSEVCDAGQARLP